MQNRDDLKEQILVIEKDADSTVNNAQLRLELDVSRAVSEEAKQLQAQQSLEIEKLKVALVNEAVHVENEREAKLEAWKERYTDCMRVGVKQLVSQLVNALIVN